MATCTRRALLGIGLAAWVSLLVSVLTAPEVYGVMLAEYRHRGIWGAR